MERTQGSDFFAHMKKYDIISVFYVWVTPSESCLKLVVTRMKYQQEDIKSRICGKTPRVYICSKCGFPKEILVKKAWYVQPRLEATYYEVGNTIHIINYQLKGKKCQIGKR